MEAALDRLSKVLEFDIWENFLDKTAYSSFISDVKEVVALAKQQPNIDAMRFELAKDISIAFFSNTKVKIENNVEAARVNVAYADALIAELQKPKP